MNAMAAMLQINRNMPNLLNKFLSLIIKIIFLVFYHYFNTLSSKANELEYFRVSKEKNIKLEVPPKIKRHLCNTLRSFPLILG
mgnify:CR=1 FL=1